jgi:Coenzyme PQQ synthesis protein D (PqqD)
VNDAVTYSRNPRVAWQVFGGEAVLVNLATGATLGLNATGGFVWSKIEEQSLDEIGRALAAEHGIPDDDARRDVSEFAELLAAEGMLLR